MSLQHQRLQTATRRRSIPPAGITIQHYWHWHWHLQSLRSGSVCLSASCCCCICCQLFSQRIHPSNSRAHSSHPTTVKHPTKHPQANPALMSATSGGSSSHEISYAPCSSPPNYFVTLGPPPSDSSSTCCRPYTPSCSRPSLFSTLYRSLTPSWQPGIHCCRKNHTSTTDLSF